MKNTNKKNSNGVVKTNRVKRSPSRSWMKLIRKRNIDPLSKDKDIRIKQRVSQSE